MKSLNVHEKAVMKLLCQGLRFKVIARELEVSHSAVVRRILKARAKIGAKNSCHACYLIGENRGLVQ